MAEVIRLPFDMPGIGRRGDYLFSDPSHPDPVFRFARVQPLDPDLLPWIREHINHRRGSCSSPYPAAAGDGSKTPRHLTLL